MASYNKELTLPDIALAYHEMLLLQLRSLLPGLAWIPTFAITGIPRNTHWTDFREMVSLNAELNHTILPEAVKQLLQDLPDPVTAEGSQKKTALLESLPKDSQDVTGDLHAELANIFTQQDELFIRNLVLQRKKGVPRQYYPSHAIQLFTRSILTAAQVGWNENIGTANPKELLKIMNQFPDYFAVLPVLLTELSQKPQFGFRITAADSLEGFVIVTDAQANRELSDQVLADSQLMRYFLANTVAELQHGYMVPTEAMIDNIIQLWLTDPLACLEYHQLRTVIHGLQVLQRLQYTPITLTAIDVPLQIKPKDQLIHTCVQYKIHKDTQTQDAKILEFSFVLAFCSAYPDLVGSICRVSANILDSSIELYENESPIGEDLYSAAQSAHASLSLHVLANFLLGWAPELPDTLPKSRPDLNNFAVAYAQICAELRHTNSLDEYLFLRDYSVW